MFPKIGAPLEYITPILIASKLKQNCYDHRLRDPVFQLGQATIARQIGVPRSTVHGWKRARTKPVVTLVAPNNYVEELERRVHVLERRTARLPALLRLCIVLLRLSGFSLVSRRLPNGDDKQKLLGSLDHASRFVRLPRLLQWIGISSSRYYDWRNSQECGLNDASSCPKSTPGQMTSKELSDMRLMLESEDYRHLSIGSIVRLASRLGKVHACSSTWYRAIQSGNWVRSRKRIYPPKPRVGLRATKPNEYWHVDTTIVRLLPGGGNRGSQSTNELGSGRTNLTPSELFFLGAVTRVSAPIAISSAFFKAALDSPPSSFA